MTEPELQINIVILEGPCFVVTLSPDDDGTYADSTMRDIRDLLEALGITLGTSEDYRNYIESLDPKTTPLCPDSIYLLRYLGEGNEAWGRASFDLATRSGKDFFDWETSVYPANIAGRPYNGDAIFCAKRRK